MTSETSETMSHGQVEFWEASVDLRRAAFEEFCDKQSEYGDAWLDLDVDTVCGQVRAEANRIRPEMEREKLRHRIKDTVAYLIMLYSLTKE